MSNPNHWYDTVARLNLPDQGQIDCSEHTQLHVALDQLLNLLQQYSCTKCEGNSKSSNFLFLSHTNRAEGNSNAGPVNIVYITSAFSWGLGVSNFTLLRHCHLQSPLVFLHDSSFPKNVHFSILQKNYMQCDLTKLNICGLCEYSACKFHITIMFK